MMFKTQIKETPFGKVLTYRTVGYNPYFESDPLLIDDSWTQTQNNKQ